MNPKILVAFVAGALVASGLVYMAVKPSAPVKAAVQLESPKPADPMPTVAEVNTPPEPVVPAAGSPKPSPVVQERKVPVPKTVAEPTAMKPSDPPPAQPPSPPQPPAEPKEPAPRPEPARGDAPAPLAVREPEPPAPPVRAPQSVTMNAGTPIQVRVGETLSTKTLKAGDTFRATLAQPLVVEGLVIAERGARAEGRIVEADQGGKMKRPAHLTLEIIQVTTSDGQNVALRTSTFVQQAKNNVAKDAAKVGIGAALGAAIGAIAGGGKGAGIGAGVGGAAGAGDVLLTKGADAVIPVETQLKFSLSDQVTITERIR